MKGELTQTKDGIMAPTSRRISKLLVDPRVIILESILVIALAVALMVVFREDTTSSPGFVEVDYAPQQANFTPEFTLPGLDGEVSLADFRGQYVLVNFWATWCPPCQYEMPDLQAYYEENRDRGFVVLSIDVEEDATLVSAFVAERHLTFPVALDAAGAVYAQYEGGDALPRSYLINPQGKLIKTWRPGRITREMLDADVTPLLGG
jgi:peroxiredoxin